MQAAKMQPQLRQDIISGLQHWYEGTSPQRDSMDGSTAGNIQDSMGWGIAFKGCIAIWWREEQEQYLKAFQSRKSSKRWTTELLKRLMATAWDMWQHRNKALHNSETNKSEILKDDINQEIQQAYGQGRASFPWAARSLL